MATLIDPALIPGRDLDPDAVAASATVLTRMGAEVERQGDTLVSGWQRLAAHYQAPHDEDLFDVLTPVQREAETAGASLVGAGVALRTFAETVRPIKAALDRLRCEAILFVDSVRGGVVQHALVPGVGYATRTVAWTDSPAAVEAHDGLVAGVAAQSVALRQAEALCAETLLGLPGAAPRPAGDNFAVTTPSVGAGRPATTDQSWGPGSVPERCGRAAVDQHESYLNGVWVDGVFGDLDGVATLVGRNPETGRWFDGSTAREAWTGLGLFAVGISTIANGDWRAPLRDDDHGRLTRAGLGAVRDTARDFVAFDTWGTDPSRAAGQVAWNVGSTFGTGGLGISLRALSAASKGGRLVGTPDVDLEPPSVTSPGPPNPIAARVKAVAGSTVIALHEVRDAANTGLRELGSRIGLDPADRLAPAGSGGQPPSTRETPWLESRSRNHGTAPEPRNVPPSPAAEREIWVLSKAQISKEMIHPKFGKFSQDRSTELWWTKDKAGHGGSKWKVYEEENGRLQWWADMDEYGTRISGKFKGSVGKGIPLKEFRGVR